MNIVLWVIQGWLGFTFLIAGGVKLAKSREALLRLQGMAYVADRSDTEMKLIGLAEVLGAVGLVIPGLLQTLRMLTPIAALCLAVLMAGAVVVHRRRGEPAVVSGALLALCLIVAVARAGLLG